MRTSTSRENERRRGSAREKMTKTRVKLTRELLREEV